MKDKDLHQEVLSIAEYLGCNGPELWSEISKTFESTMLSVIGDNGPTYDGGGYPDHYSLSRNDLRAEQRTRLRKILYGK